jgi:signal transduction histidine kinase/CHASE3 domain sensor protein
LTAATPVKGRGGPGPAPVSRRETFRRSAWIGFAAAGLLIIMLAAGAIAALRGSIESSHAAFQEARDIVEFGQVNAEVDRKMTAFRNWIVTRDEGALVGVEEARRRIREALADLEKRATGTERQQIRRIIRSEQDHQEALLGALEKRRAGADDEAVRQVVRQTVEPKRVDLERNLHAYLDAKESTIGSLERTARAANRSAFAGLLLVASAALVTLLVLSIRVTSRLGTLFEAERRARREAEANESERADLLRREREARSHAEAAEKRSAFLARASRNLSSTLEAEAALKAIADLVVPEFCDWCIVDLAIPGSVRRVAVRHGDAGDPLARRIEGSHLLDPEAAFGPPMVLRSGVPELIEEVTDEALVKLARNPEALGILREMRIRSMIIVPMRDSEAVVGILTFLTAESGRRFEPDDLLLAEDLAGRAGIAMENVRLFELVKQERALAEWQERRSSFLARASEVLASSLDYRTTLGSVAQLAVPEVADWCLVDIVEAGGGLHTIAVHHSDSAKEQLARSIGRRYPWRLGQPYGAPHVVATGRPELARDVQPEMLRSLAVDDEHFELLSSLGFRSYMCVPLEVRGDVLGAITFISAESARRYETDDLALAEALSYRASLAIDNARLYDDAQAAIRGRDDFLSIASHELKTPVTTLQIQIQSFIRKLQGSARNELADVLLTRLQSSERQVERLTHLINNLLDISRITGGRLDLTIEDVDFAQVVRDAAGRLEETFSRAGCPLTVAASGPQMGRWDRLRLEQIVTNLLSNALKYGAGRPVEVSLSTAQGSEGVVLEVADHGIGIAPENVPRIFERFERAVSGHHYGGLGLGLWIVRQIVEGLGGRIRVRSQPGAGSVFRVELPRSHSLEAEPDARSSAGGGK